MAPAVVRNALEVLMETQHSEPFSRLGLGYYRQGREEGREEGREQGLLEGERGTVRMLLKARRLELAASQDRQLDECTNLAQLKAWAEAALTADTTDDVFTAPPADAK